MCQTIKVIPLLRFPVPEDIEKAVIGEQFRVGRESRFGRRIGNLLAECNSREIIAVLPAEYG
jgi:hypothetical protein